ncbi:MAG: hypothetical protein WCV88_05950 [Patescibacteria group bacterium]|jgi:hypothetical protein
MNNPERQPGSAKMIETNEANKPAVLALDEDVVSNRVIELPPLDLPEPTLGSVETTTLEPEPDKPVFSLDDSQAGVSQKENVPMTEERQAFLDIKKFLSGNPAMRKLPNGDIEVSTAAIRWVNKNNQKHQESLRTPLSVSSGVQEYITWQDAAQAMYMSLDDYRGNQRERLIQQRDDVIKNVNDALSFLK